MVLIRFEGAPGILPHAMYRTTSATFAVLAILAIGGGSFGVQAPSSRYAETGSYSVELADIPLGQSARGRQTGLRVYYPSGSGPFPIIVYSHAAGGRKENFAAVSQHWASHGYVVLHPSHDDTGISIATGNMAPAPAQLLGRVADVRGSVDFLEFQIESFAPGLRGKTDQTRMGIAGDGYGAVLAMLAGGVRADVGEVKDRDLTDARARCIVPIAPSGAGDFGLTATSWDTLTIPALFITGSADLRAGRAPDWRHEGFQRAPSGGKYLLDIRGAERGSYGGDNPKSAAPRYVMAASTAFWDSCLKNSASAGAYLREPGGFKAFAGAAATLSIN